MARSNLPGNILKQANTGLLSQLLAGNKVRAGIQDAQVTGAEDTVQDYSNLSAQNLMAELQGVTAIDPRTGVDDPIMAAAKRQQRVDNRSPWDLTNMEKVNAAMPLMETKGKADYLTDVAVKDKLLSESHKQIDREQLFKIGQSQPGTPAHEQAIAESIQYNVQNNVTAPGVTALATQSFNNKDLVFAKIKNPNGDVIGDTVTNAVGDIANAKSWNTNAYNAAKNVAVTNMAKANPHIRDRAVFEARFDKMITDHPEYGQKFKLGKADEAGMTIDTQTLEKYATEISDGVNNLDTVAGGKTVVSSVNGMLSYMSKNRIKKGDLDNYDDLIVRTLERDPLTSTGIFQKVAKDELVKLNQQLTNGTIKQEEYDSARNSLANIQNWEVIDTNFQAKAKKYVREYYRAKHPELNDRILDKSYDRIINSGSDNISVAVGIGKDNAVSKTKTRQIREESKQRIYQESVIKLDNIREKTLPNYLINALGEKLNKDFPDTLLSQNDRRRLRDQTKKLAYIMEDRVGRKLTGENRAAFLLAVERMVLNNIGVDTGSKLWGLNITDADFSLVDNDEMNKSNTLELMELFHASIPHSDTIAAAKGKEVKLKKGAETLKSRVGKYVEKLRKLPKGDSAVPSFFAKTLNKIVGN
jgi:hypothetical protein